MLAVSQTLHVLSDTVEAVNYQKIFQSAFEYMSLFDIL